MTAQQIVFWIWKRIDESGGFTLADARTLERLLSVMARDVVIPQLPQRISLPFEVAPAGTRIEIEDAAGNVVETAGIGGLKRNTARERIRDRMRSDKNADRHFYLVIPSKHN